ncbi:hypothetical protein D1841_05370 [Neglecta sp. X4]|nr:hypothetical protein [Neglectibacter sp. 59]NBJ72757.1 hypothetical protein [Neglectibacter sp. X4]NCE80640.1 hypothetical protein [Neglectibacter sp. X58]
MKHQPFAAVPFLSSYFSRFLPGWLTAGPVPVFGGAENLLWFFLFSPSQVYHKTFRLSMEKPRGFFRESCRKKGEYGKKERKSPEV